jgi:hypothetical protein
MIRGDQQMQLTEEEDLRNLLMIGGIQIFLPFAQEEAEVCVADVEAATTEAGQPAETVRKKNWSRFGTAQAEEEDEHSEEWLNTFSQEAERTATWEFAEEEEEEADNISLADLYEQIEALEERVKVQSVHIQQVKLEAADEAGMGDHCDLPDYRKILQPRRLHEQSQPLEQLDEVIEMIRELMIRSAETASEEKLSRKRRRRSSSSNSNNNREMEQMNNSRNLFGIQEDFHS